MSGNCKWGDCIEGITKVTGLDTQSISGTLPGLSSLGAVTYHGADNTVAPQPLGPKGRGNGESQGR